MQWPPTNPGLYELKFHLVSAALRTDSVSISNSLKNIDSSLIRPIFKSLWVFSMIFAASAIFILLTLWVPAGMISWYKLLTTFEIYSVEPDVTFLISVILWFLSPGLIRSGLYPQKKSVLKFNFDSFSRIGTHTSSVQPG